MVHGPWYAGWYTWLGAPRGTGGQHCGGPRPVQPWEGGGLQGQLPIRAGTPPEAPVELVVVDAPQNDGGLRRLAWGARPAAAASAPPAAARPNVRPRCTGANLRQRRCPNRGSAQQLVATTVAAAAAEDRQGRSCTNRKPEREAKPSAPYLSSPAARRTLPPATRLVTTKSLTAQERPSRSSSTGNIVKLPHTCKPYTSTQ